MPNITSLFTPDGAGRRVARRGRAGMPAWEAGRYLTQTKQQQASTQESTDAGWSLRLSEKAELDAELCTVVAAWPDLVDVIRKGIVASVSTAKQWQRDRERSTRLSPVGWDPVLATTNRRGP